MVSGTPGFSREQKPLGGSGVHHRLFSGFEGHQAIMNIAERRRDFVTQAVVQRKPRAKTPLVLGVGSQLPATQVTREVAASLSEDIRPTQFKVRQRVVRVTLNRERKGARGKIRLVAVNLRPAELSAEAGNMFALRVGDVRAEGVVVLGGVARVDDRIAHVGVALRHDQRRAGSGWPGGCISETERLR